MSELELELERLRKRIDRERRARLEAETLAEQGTRLLYERGQQMELLYTIADACSRAVDVEAAIQVALDELCAYMAWPIGHAYMVGTDRTHPLVPTKLWHLDHAEPSATFREVCEHLRFRRGEGLPGRVLENGGPEWVADVTQDDNFPRRRQAAEIGLRGALAVPVMAGQNIVAVLEFFSRELANPEKSLLDLLAQVATQVGRTFERQARDEADRANHAKSEFLSRMSHELRTPLNAILGFSQLLDRNELTPVHRERVGYILRAGRHLLNLINEVLDITRIEAGRMELSLEPVKLADVVPEVFELARPLASERTITIECSSTEMSCVVLADRQRLKQVLLNLVANAVKYNQDKGRVVLTCEPVAGEKWRIAVTDTGRGVPPGKRAQLFTPFERLGAEETGIEGTGLGLALSKRLGEAMHGTVGYEEAAEGGSTFWIELPKAEAPHDLLARSGAGARFAASSLCETPKTVLYIEDNLSNLTLVEHLLGDHPEVKLISAMQGRLGFDLAMRHRPDLILLDLHLPDWGGREVLARLKAEPETCHIPVAILSADATSLRVAQLRKAGAVDYLTKPLDVGRFLDLLKKQLGAAERVAA